MVDLNPDRQREFALEVVRKLRDAGYEALWAGGCVRDQLLGLVPKDYDVATNATPDEIRALFGKRRTLAIGVAFGVVTVLGPRPAGQIEVATFRADSKYSDGRHPDEVTFTGAQEDAQRRDFTINGIFYDPISNDVIDYVDGEADLAARLIRAIGNAAERIAEDKLRMLRAVRFATTFDFQIEPATLRAVQESAQDISQVSNERIGAEMRRMLLDRNRARAIDLLQQADLLSPVLPEVAELFDTTRWEVTLQTLGRLDDPSLSLALAALFQSVAEPDSISKAGRRLRFTNKEVELAAWLLKNLPTVQQATQVNWPQLQRVLVQSGADELMSRREVSSSPDDDSLKYCRERLSQPPDELNPRPLLDGADLIEHGLPPGPEFSQMLQQVRDAQLEGEIATREEALSKVDQLRRG